MTKHSLPCDNCGRNHRSLRTLIRCQVPSIEWISGTGNIALIAWCRVPTVTLHQSMESALKSKRLIDHTACGGLCHRSHQIVRYDQ